MDLIDRIRLARSGDVIGRIIHDASFATPSEVAALLGLSPAPHCYRAIDRIRATNVLEQLLGRDMAYDAETMPPGLASELAAEFLALFDGPEVRFFTNGDWDKERHLSSWNPATDATFDGGVIALGASRSGCVWFMDED